MTAPERPFETIELLAPTDCPEIELQAERDGRSMGEVVLQSGWHRLRRLKPPKGMLEGAEACG